MKGRRAYLAAIFILVIGFFLFAGITSDGYAEEVQKKPPGDLGTQVVKLDRVIPITMLYVGKPKDNICVVGQSQLWLKPSLGIQYITTGGINLIQQTPRKHSFRKPRDNFMKFNGELSTLNIPVSKAIMSYIALTANGGMGNK